MSGITLTPESERGTIRGPDTASMFIPQSFAQPKPCCPEFPQKTPLYRKFIGYGCFLLLISGFQMMALGLSESRQFDEAIGQGFYLVENYFKAAAAATCFVAALVGALAIRLNSLRAMIGFGCLLSLIVVLIGLAEVMTRSYSVEQTIHSYVKEYVDARDDEYATSARKMLNRIQHEFGCCGGRHGAKDFGKRELLPASCCYEAHHEHEHEEHEGPEGGEEAGEHFCNTTATPQAVHPNSCSMVTGRYLRHVLLSSEITGIYVIVVSLICFLFSVLYGLQVYQASQGHKERAGEDLRAAEDESRAQMVINRNNDDSSTEA